MGSNPLTRFLYPSTDTSYNLNFNYLDTIEVTWTPWDSSETVNCIAQVHMVSAVGGSGGDTLSAAGNGSAFLPLSKATSSSNPKTEMKIDLVGSCQASNEPRFNVTYEPSWSPVTWNLVNQILPKTFSLSTTPTMTTIVASTSIDIPSPISAPISQTVPISHSVLATVAPATNTITATAVSPPSRSVEVQTTLLVLSSFTLLSTEISTISILESARSSTFMTSQTAIASSTTPTAVPSPTNTTLPPPTNSHLNTSAKIAISTSAILLAVLSILAAKFIGRRIGRRFIRKKGMSAPHDPSRSELPTTTRTELDGLEVAHQMYGDGHAHELDGRETGIKELEGREVLLR